MASIASAAIVSGELIIGLDDGQIIRAGYVQGPQGLQGERGPQGSTGQPGRDGNTLLHGVGTPQFSDGVDGDLFYSTDQVAIYGPRINGNWGKPVYLRPQDNKSFTLPTGMKSQGSSSAGRAFAASMGGPGGGGGLPPAPTGDGLDLITGHNKPLPPGITTLIASDTKGDAMHVIVKADSTTGSWYGEIIVTHFGGVSDHAVAWEVPIAGAPTLTFSTRYNVDHLELSVNSDQPLTNIRGKIIYV